MAQARIGSEILGPESEPYRLSDFLGRGAFGEVYRAIGLVLGRVVAVKLLPLDEIDETSTRTALLNEIQLASQVKHPNVIEVLSVNTDTSRDIGPYLVMEYLSGGTLSTRLRNQAAAHSPIPLDLARKMMMDIAQGARAINAKLVHRDIKPDNILLDGDRLKIGDFGISKVIDEQTRTHTFKGGQHIWYMAPEGWEREPNTFKLDVYSVGLVFYVILTLQHPLAQLVNDKGDWRAWRDVHLFGQCPDVRSQRDDMDSALSQLLGRMVAKRPQERPGWDEIISLLDSVMMPLPQSIAVSAAVEAAIRRRQEIEKAQLAQAEIAEQEAHKAELYRYSCDQLLARFDKLVEDFNAQFQFGQIRVQGGRRPKRTYGLPTGGQIECDFFERRESETNIAGGTLIGGGYVSVDRGVSANLLLIQEGSGDLYGKWLGCFVRISASVDPNKFKWGRGLTPETVQPFGFRNGDDFYKEIIYAEHGIHVFKYEVRADVEQLFGEILEMAFREVAQRN